MIAALHGRPCAEPVQVSWRGDHSNDIYEVGFPDGRALLLKRARHDWGSAGFATTRRASRLLSRSSDIIAPRPLQLTDQLCPAPLQAYWRIPLPTLARLWPGLDPRARVRALRSWGRLLRRLHAVEPPGYGPVTNPAPHSLAAALDADLRRRLLPAVYAHWPEGACWLERLIDLAPAAARRRGAACPVLVHGDMHMGNVLCRVEDGDVQCVGLLDLDGAAGAPPEHDFATLELLHGRLFARRVPSRALRQVVSGYGTSLDPWLLDFYRCVQLANQGFTSGLLGHDAHARFITIAFERHVRRVLGRGR